MENLNPSEPVLSDEEKRIIQLARQFEALKMNPAWQELRSKLHEFSNEPMRELSERRYAPDKMKLNFLRMHEERKAFIDFIDSYLEGISKARIEIIRTLAEMNGHYGEAAEDLVSALEGRTH